MLVVRPRTFGIRWYELVFDARYRRLWNPFGQRGYALSEGTVTVRPEFELKLSAHAQRQTGREPGSESGHRVSLPNHRPAPCAVLFFQRLDGRIHGTLGCSRHDAIELCLVLGVIAGRESTFHDVAGHERSSWGPAVGLHFSLVFLEALGPPRKQHFVRGPPRIPLGHKLPLSERGVATTSLGIWATRISDATRPASLTGSSLPPEKAWGRLLGQELTPIISY